VFRTIPKRYVAVLAAVAVAQLLDLATFIPAVARVGIGAESNPLARTLYELVGPWGPAALKMTVIAIMLIALARVARRFPRYAVPSGALVVGIGLLGAGSNLLFGLLR
jgi:threonine/homoserine efflux transporter RhtA